MAAKDPLHRAMLRAPPVLERRHHAQRAAQLSRHHKIHHQQKNPRPCRHTPPQEPPMILRVVTVIHKSRGHRHARHHQKHQKRSHPEPDENRMRWKPMHRFAGTKKIGHQFRNHPQLIRSLLANPRISCNPNKAFSPPTLTALLIPRINLPHRPHSHHLWKVSQESARSSSEAPDPAPPPAPEYAVFSSSTPPAQPPSPQKGSRPARSASHSQKAASPPVSATYPDRA